MMGHFAPMASEYPVEDVAYDVNKSALVTGTCCSYVFINFLKHIN